MCCNRISHVMESEVKSFTVDFVTRECHVYKEVLSNAMGKSCFVVMTHADNHHNPYAVATCNGTENSCFRKYKASEIKIVSS